MNIDRPSLRPDSAAGIFRRLWLWLLFIAAFAALFMIGAPVGANATDLFFSEYVEGSSFNKVLEVYNGTGAAVDLATGGYDVQIFFNGSNSAGATISLTGIVAHGDVHVLANNSASATIIAVAEQTSGSVNFNGDDAVVLRKGGVVIDSIGQIGVDPGSQWGSGDVSTQDNTIRRMANVCAGDADASDTFDPSLEWDGFAIDTFDGLGTHIANCGGGDPAPSVFSTSPSNGAINVDVNTNIDVNFSEDVNVTGSWFEINCDSSGTHTAAVSGGPQSFTLDPDTDFANSEKCTVTIFADQVSDTDTDDPPDNMAADFVFTFDTVSGAPLPEVVINEIIQNPAAVSDANGEWFEVHNPTGAAIDMDGWTIKDDGSDSHVINNGEPLIVPAGGYLVLGRNADSGANGGVTVAYQYSSFFLGNSDDEVVLLDTLQREVDRVEYDGGPNFPDPNGASMSLIDPAVDNNVGVNWCESSTPFGDGDLGTPGAANVCPPPEIVINEIMQNPDAVSDNTGEWVELFNDGGRSVNIDGWTIKDDDSDSHLIDNGGPLVIPVGGYLVLGRNADSAANGGVTVDYQYSGFFLSNGADEVILLDVGGNEIDRVEYDGGPDFPDPTGASMSLSSPELDNNVGANWCEAVTQFGDGDKGTPGGINICEILTIMEIQGAGHLSPYENDVVATNGIVTAVAFDGFFVQDPDGDGDDDTSDGMWVFMGNFCNGCPSAGDEVQLIDRVDEFIPGGPDTGNLSTTDMAFPSITVLSTGNDLPEPVIIGRSGRIPPRVDVISEDELPVNLQDVPGVFNPDNDGIDFFESLEGMLVTVEDAVAVSAVRSFGTFSSELFTLPNNGHPDVIAPNNVRTDRGGINLAADADGYGDLNPERVQIQFDASDLPFATGTLFPGTVPEINLGDRLGDVTGVVGYDFGNFEVRATLDFTTTSSLLEPETTSLAGTEKALTVASYNVLNLSPLASDDDQRAKLGSQIANNLGGPDVVALQEIQDNNGDISDCEDQNSEEFCEELAETGDGVVDATETLQLLVDSIAAAGGPSYEFFNVNPPEGSSGGIPLGNIRNAFLYNPDRVELDGFVSLTETILSEVGADPNAFFDTRKPLAATFVFEGETFTVINNHLSSRSGSTPIFGGPQPFVQAAEDERESQVDALNRYVDFLLEDDKDARVIVLGDFNTFEFTDDLTEILPGTLDGRAIMKSILDEIEDDNRYTFIFDGNSQVLDHMFATRSLLEEARFDIVHVNVDFSRLFLDTTASDHEPIVGLYDLSSK